MTTTPLTTFTGGGLNGPSMLAAINGSMDAPSKYTVPAGATWPFVTLSVSNKSVEFNMMHIRKVALREDIKEVYLSKTGYLFFRTNNSATSFGFTTFKLNKLLKSLENQGFKLHVSCRENLMVAKLSLASMLVIFLLIFLTVTVMSNIKPNGV